MLMEIVAYLLIAFQLHSVLCRPQSHNFDGSNPYYDAYRNNQYWGNNDNVNPYSTTQKSLYPTLYPQNPNTTPQPYYAKGQYSSTPPTNYFNRNSSYHNPTNTHGSNNNSFGWNANFNPYTTPSPTYQPYGQFSTTTVKPPVTTLPPFYPSGSFNQYNRTNPTYPASNRTIPTHPIYPNYNSNRTSPTYPAPNRTNPTYPAYRPQTTLPPYTPQPHTFSNYRPQPTYPNNGLQPNINHSQRNYTNNYNNTFTNGNWNRNNTSPPQHPYPYQNNGQVTKNNNFPNVNPINSNFNRNDNNYNPQYGPSAPPLMPTKPTYDHNGIPLASFSTFHANQPIDDHLFNYDNLLRRQPNNGMQSGQFEQSNHVPLAPFPGQKAPTYDSISNVPLAPFPG